MKYLIVNIKEVPHPSNIHKNKKKGYEWGIQTTLKCFKCNNEYTITLYVAEDFNDLINSFKGKSILKAKYYCPICNKIN